MAKDILAAKDRLAELNEQIVETRQKEKNAAVAVAVCGGSTVALFVLSALWIF